MMADFRRLRAILLLSRMALLDLSVERLTIGILFCNFGNQSGYRR